MVLAVLFLIILIFVCVTLILVVFFLFFTLGQGDEGIFFEVIVCLVNGRINPCFYFGLLSVSLVFGAHVDKKDIDEGTGVSRVLILTFGREDSSMHDVVFWDCTNIFNSYRSRQPSFAEFHGVSFLRYVFIGGLHLPTAFFLCFLILHGDFFVLLVFFIGAFIL